LIQETVAKPEPIVLAFSPEQKQPEKKKQVSIQELS